MAELGRSYDEWRRLAFPPGNVRDDLDDLNGRLVLVGAWVAETVIPIAERDHYSPAVPDVLGELGSLRDESRRLGELLEQEESGLARGYGRYIGALAAV